MGPSWTELVVEGLSSFPQATHGILADAVGDHNWHNEYTVLLLSQDFTPLNSFDKRQLVPTPPLPRVVCHTM